MNGAQDMGGLHGFGPVEPEQNEPVFHADWEKRAFALTLAMGTPGGWNIDMSRFVRENRPRAESVSYTHLDVYKRQGTRFRATCWSRSKVSPR